VRCGLHERRHDRRDHHHDRRPPHVERRDVHFDHDDHDHDDDHDRRWYDDRRPDHQRWFHHLGEHGDHHRW
jgi:hypothetical protein